MFRLQSGLVLATGPQQEDESDVVCLGQPLPHSPPLLGVAGGGEDHQEHRLGADRLRLESELDILLVQQSEEVGLPASPSLPPDSCQLAGH